MSKNITQAYRQLADIVTELDDYSRTLREYNRRIEELHSEISNISSNIFEKKGEMDELLLKGAQVGNEYGIPFTYQEPDDDEWESSDEWNSSQKCW